MQKFEKILKEVCSPAVRPSSFFLYYPCPLTEQEILDKVVEIAQENHTLKVYKHLIESERKEDKTCPIKYYIPEGWHHRYLTAEELLESNLKPSIHSEPIEVYPSKTIYKLIVYMQ